MNIKSITISGFHKITLPVTYDFDICTLIYGNNGVGKTTILQAIQWALLGFIPGTNKNKSSIFEHANHNDMSVQLTFDDGQQIFRRLYQTGPEFDIMSEERVPDNLDVLQNLTLPIMQFDDFIGMTANKLKSWFTEFLPEHQVDIDIHQRFLDALPEYLKLDSHIDSLYSDIMETISFEADRVSVGIEYIQLLNDAVKNHIKYYKNELASLESTIQTLVFYSDINTDVDSQALKNDIAELDKEISAYETYMQVCDNNNRIQQKIDDINAKLNDSEIEYIKHDIETLNKLLADIQLQGTQLKSDSAVLSAQASELSNILSSDGMCPYTKEKCQTLLDQMDGLQEKYDKLIASESDMSKEIAQKRSEYSQINTQLTAAKSNLNELDNLTSELKSLQEQVVNVNSDAFTEDIDTMRTALNAKNDQLIKIEANIKYEKSIEEFNLKKQETATIIDILKSWDTLTDVNGLQSEILVLGDQFSDLSNTMDGLGLLPDKVNFEVGEKNKFSFGVKRNDAYIKYNQLSSGEKCLFTITLLLSLLKLSTVPLKLIMIDDMLDHLDSVNLQRVTEYISNNKDIQVIFAGVFDNIPKLDAVQMLEIR